MTNDSDEIAYSIGFEQIDLAVLPADARELGSDAFLDAITVYLTQQHQKLAVSPRIVVNALERRIDVVWRQNPSMPGIEQCDSDMSRERELTNAVPSLELLTEQYPDSPQHFSNLGVALCELGQFGKAKLILERAVELGAAFDTQIALNVAVAIGAATLHLKAGRGPPDDICTTEGGVAILDNSGIELKVEATPKTVREPIACKIAKAIGTDFNGRVCSVELASPELMKELNERFYQDLDRSPVSVLKPERGILVFAKPGIRLKLVWRKLEPWWFADANLDEELDDDDANSSPEVEPPK